jgi:hypothetical protein
MALTVNLRTQRGINYNRKFNPGEGVSIYGKATGVLGLGEFGTHVRLQVNKGNTTVYFKETYTNLWGDYDFYYVMPLNDMRLDFILIASYSVAGQDDVTVPVSVGNLTPAPLPRPQGEGLPWWVLPAVLVVGGVYLFRNKIL